MNSIQLAMCVRLFVCSCVCEYISHSRYVRFERWALHSNLFYRMFHYFNLRTHARRTFSAEFIFLFVGPRKCEMRNVKWFPCMTPYVPSHSTTSTTTKRLKHIYDTEKKIHLIYVLLFLFAIPIPFHPFSYASHPCVLCVCGVRVHICRQTSTQAFFSSEFI